jgi:hypothetical protein
MAPFLPLLWLALPLLLFVQRADATRGRRVFPDHSGSCDLTLEVDDGSLDDDLVDVDDEILPVTAPGHPVMAPSRERVYEDLVRPASVPPQRLFRPPRRTSA